MTPSTDREQKPVKLKKQRISPRQKMINLMYVVLMAMLALNVSSDVMNGFSLVERSLNKSTENSSKQNDVLYGNFNEQMKANPSKVKEWYEKAVAVRRMSDSLYDFAQELKVAIVKEADGADGNVEDIQNKENLEAAAQVMLAPGRGRGKLLYQRIIDYRNRILAYVDDENQRGIISSNLSTDIPKKNQMMGKNWIEYMFESTPAAAATLLLTKLQNDVRYAEGEVLHTLAKNVDLKDVRVNQLNAYVVPNAQTIVQGGKFSARIIMAAVDTTQEPIIYIGDRKMSLAHGLYETVCGKTGDFSLDGHIEVTDASGSVVRRNFSQKYSVVAPSATVSADLMNVLYAGYNNPISISVPGVPSNKIVATMSGGTLQAVAPGKYIARPTAVGELAEIVVSSQSEGGIQKMGSFNFRVRRLPDPTAYIACKDEKSNRVKYVGGRGLAKSDLLNAEGIGAAIDDGLLDIAFKVISFETVFFDNMGNAIPEVAKGDRFTDRQRDIFRRLGRGKRFYITRVNAVGPDGTTRILPQALEVIVK